MDKEKRKRIDVFSSLAIQYFSSLDPKNRASNQQGTKSASLCLGMLNNFYLVFLSNQITEYFSTKYAEIW
jgi:hypothetical protein